MSYRPVVVTEFADVYQFGPSHMYWAARNSLAAHEARGLGDTEGAEKLREFIKDLKAHIGVRAQVIAAEARPINPLLVDADRKVDVTYGQFIRRIRNEIRLYGEKSERGSAALRMLDSPLGMPISAVTNVERIEQESLLKNILNTVEGEFLEEVDTLELGSHFELLKEDTSEFVRLMTFDSKKERLPSRTELEEERKELQARMVGCMYRVLGQYPELTDEDLEMRSALLGPFAIQNDRIGAYMRRRRGGGSRIPPEINDETGEFIDEEPVDPEVVDPTLV